MILLYILLIIQIIIAQDAYIVCHMNDIAKYVDIDPSEGYEDLQV